MIEEFAVPNSEFYCMWIWFAAHKCLHFGMLTVRCPSAKGFRKFQICDFSFHTCWLIGSGAHTASYPMSTRDSFPGQ